MVEPMSPHLMFENTTCVVALFASMSVGLPSVALHGPLLPESSQFMNWLLSFQMLKAKTMPRPSASPIVVREPNSAALPSTASHHVELIESPVGAEMALGTVKLFWWYTRLIWLSVPVVVPSSVMN